MNIYELGATLTLDDKGFTEGIEKSERSAQGLSASTVAIGNIIANAFEAMIGKVVAFAESVVTAGAEAETALAKVNTIMDTSVVNVGDMNDAIVKLSSEMGVSVTELSDTVYNAISATGDTANAVSLAEKASKLATAGFTDTSSALGVLTTAMNAYGLSAEEAGDISDSLIMVQNLGVTTVSELSSSMGKAIASASAYNVNLSNLESAYVSITKAGINTAEGTTYISSMLKELGDSGSEVAKTLKAKTGKSFSELMDEGKTLGDVLGVLQDSVDGDATALMNLWGSAEAGKASNAIVSQGLQAFNDNLKAISGSAGATESAYGVMADTFSHKTEVLKTNFENFKIQLFEQVEPALNKVIDALGFLVDHMDIVLPIVTAVTTGLGILATALGIHKIIGMVTTAFTAFNAVLMANPIMLVVTVIGALIAGLMTLWATNENFRNFITNLWNAIKTNIIGGISNIITAIGSWLTNMDAKIKDGIPTIINNLVTFFKQLPSKLLSIGTEIVNGLWTGIKNSWNTLTSNVSGLFGSFVQGIKDKLGIASPSKVFKGIAHWMVEGLNVGWNDEFPAVRSGIISGMDFSGEMDTSFNAGGGFGGSVVYNQTVNVNREVATADEMARAVRQESRYGLMKGVALA